MEPHPRCRTIPSNILAQRFRYSRLTSIRCFCTIDGGWANMEAEKNYQNYKNVSIGGFYGHFCFPQLVVSEISLPVIWTLGFAASGLHRGQR